MLTLGKTLTEVKDFDETIPNIDLYDLFQLRQIPYE